MKSEIAIVELNRSAIRNSSALANTAVSVKIALVKKHPTAGIIPLLTNRNLRTLPPFWSTFHCNRLAVLA